MKHTTKTMMFFEVMPHYADSFIIKGRYFDTEREIPFYFFAYRFGKSWYVSLKATRTENTHIRRKFKTLQEVMKWVSQKTRGYGYSIYETICPCR